jgi:ribosomal protein L28
MKTCSICDKGYFVGGTRKLLRGHYNPTSDSRKKPNLQWATIPGKPGRFKVCAKCLKLIKKSAAKKTVKSTSKKSVVKK